MKMSENEKKTNKEAKEKAKIERYREKTKARAQNGGAGVRITFYNLDIGDRKLRVKRRSASRKK